MSRGDAETANTFGIERLVAVCHSIMSSHDGVARHIDPGELLSQVGSRIFSKHDTRVVTSHQNCSKCPLLSRRTLQVAVLEQMRLVDRKSGPQQVSCHDNRGCLMLLTWVMLSNDAVACWLVICARDCYRALEKLHEPKFRALFDRELLDAVAQTIRDRYVAPNCMPGSLYIV